MDFKIIESFPQLYGLSSKDKVKLWSIDVIGLYNKVYIRTVHGYLDGAMQEGLKEVESGKNIGKSNETTKQVQAVSEAAAIYKKKKDGGYTLGILRSSTKELPMLAHSYADRKHEVLWDNGAYGQPKLNGIRCFATKISEDEMLYTSRAGKQFNTLEILTPSLLEKLEVNGRVDGEIFTKNLTFQEICTAVKREKKENSLKHLLEFWVYDFPSEPGGFASRTEKVYSIFNRDDTCDPVKRVSTVNLYSEDDLKEYHTQNVRNGYEGTMIRNKQGDYVYNHRSTNLLKYKDFMDEEFEIIGGKDGKGRAKGQCTFRCVTTEGKKFDVRCKGTNAVREEYLQNLNSYIGKALTVKFQAWSDDMIPIFPVGISIRDYE
jgi:DNA ligase-1